jgi:inorganic pyrophosphatase
MMATPWTKLEPTDRDTGKVRVVVEAPMRSRNKYKLDEDFGLFVLDKVLPLGASFPFDFGFIPRTQGEDGDPLDVLLLGDEPTFPGCVVLARLIGVVEAEQTDKGETVRNDRLIAATDVRYHPAAFESLEQLGKGRVDEIEHFFISYNHIEGRQFKPIGRHGPARAQRLLEEGIRRFGGKK